ncbi:acyltransferase [Sphingobium limneticum]|uniref:acyltransferase n=1 Tax=Sphingobium limneticum TaxID=1007511 RepID=UPI0024AFEABC|nr:acyltransferase [Sphingobium limneticum]
MNKLRAVRRFLVGIRRSWLRYGHGVLVDPSASVSLSSRFIAGRRNDIVVGAQSLVAFKTLVYTQDHVSGEHKPVRIGRHCFIGGGSVIMPGVTVGDRSIVAAGSVVFNDVPPCSIVGGNPARLLRADVEVGPYGRLKNADENVKQMWR